MVLFDGPRDLLTSMCHSTSCSCDVICVIIRPRYCNYLVLNCLSISLPVPILLNTSSLVIFSVHDMFKTLRYIHNSKASSLDNSDFVIGYMMMLFVQSGVHIYYGNTYFGGNLVSC